MNAFRTLSAIAAGCVALALSLTIGGCKSSTPPVNDDTLSTQLQARLFSDQNLSGQPPIQASVSNGVATLSGTVTSDTARSIASGDAAQVEGIRTVVNNLVVQVPPAATATTAAPAPIRSEPVRKPSASIPQHAAVRPPAPVVRNTPAPQPQPEQRTPVQESQIQTPPPPPTPARHEITLPSGTSIPVRITQTLDSASTQTGDKFTGAIASDIIVDGMVVLPQGTPVTGHVDAVQDAAHFKGSSLLTVSLSSISRKGERIDVATEAYTKQGEGRGKNTAEKVGGGAAVGAILGGIFGGGKGAAIGAAAGGGVGAGANGVTRGQQVQIPSETVVRFKLSDPIIIHVTNGLNSSDTYGPGLERRNQ
jgi:hypothetical protein